MLRLHWMQAICTFHHSRPQEHFAIFCVTFAQYAYSIVGTCDRQDGSEKLLAICAIWSGNLVFNQKIADPNEN